MKLFDRSVDLAQFNENSSLYSIARAWISNKAQQEDRLSTTEPTYSQDEEVGQDSQNYFHQKSTCRPRWLSWMRRPTGDQEVVGSTPAEVGNILS